MEILKRYIKACRLQTALFLKNIYVLLFICCLSVAAFFLRDDIFLQLSDYPVQRRILISCSMLYVVFLKANLGCRITLLLTKGLPFFLNNNKNRFYCLFYVFYNIYLIVFSLLTLKRIYTFMYTYNAELCINFFKLNCTFACTLLVLYIYFYYNNIDYEKIDKQDVKFTFIPILLLSISPIFLTAELVIFFFFKELCVYVNK